MTVCPNCAEENSERARFCWSCGTPLFGPSEGSTPSAAAGAEQPYPAAARVSTAPTTPVPARRPDSPMVGRERETAILQDQLDRATSERACRLVVVSGPAGVGKSRLVDEFAADPQNGVAVIRARCLLSGEGLTFWPLVEVVRQAAGLGESGSAEAARSKIEALLAEEEDAAAVAPRIVQLMGLPGGQGVPEETLWGIRRFLETLARLKPLVLVIDDAHAAEAMLSELLGYLVRSMRNTALLLVCMVRREPEDEGPRTQPSDDATSIHLEPLNAVDCGSLIGNILGGTDLGAEARARITEASGGNPLFVEQMISTLIDEGLLREEQGRWLPATDLSSVPVPPSLQALLEARLQGLGPGEAAVIERAAIVGETFSLGPVAGLLPDEARPAIAGNLMTLVGKDLIRPDRSDPAREDAYRFTHALLCDIAYQRIGPESKAEQHDRYAGWLERAAGERAPELEGVLAHHLEQAYRLRSEAWPGDGHAVELSARAAARLSAAGRMADDRGDHGAAALLLDRAVRLWPSGEPGRAEPLLTLSAALRDVGDDAGADAALVEAAAAARAAGERDLEWRARVLRAGLRPATAPGQDTLERSRLTAEQALDVFEESGDEQGLSWARLLMASIHEQRGNLSVAAEAAERALEHAQRVRRPREEDSALRTLLRANLYGPDPVSDSVKRCEEILERVRGSRPLEQQVLGTLALLEAARGRPKEARELDARATSGAVELGLESELAKTALRIGRIEVLAGDPAAAENELRRAYEIAERSGDRTSLAAAAAGLAELACEQQRPDEALRLAEVARTTAPAEDMDTQVQWRTARAKALASGGRLQEADAVAREAVRLADQTDSPEFRGAALMGLAETLRLAGRTDEAGAFAEQATRAFERRGNVAAGSKARALLGELTSRQA